MQATVFCKTTAKATQSFFVKVGGRDYFLHSTAVKKTLDKIPSYIRYIEKEYDVAIYEKTKKKLETKKKNPYKRDTFRWQDYAWEVA